MLFVMLHDSPGFIDDDAEPASELQAINLNPLLNPRCVVDAGRILAWLKFLNTVRYLSDRCLQELI